MAGIGFELKKLFQKRGLAATAKPGTSELYDYLHTSRFVDRDQFLLYGRDEIYCGYAV